MREILFRGKREDTDEWIYGGLLISTDIVSCTEIAENTGMGDRYDVIPETVGQFTGLTDKNGMKIFEGDILKTKQYGKVSNYIIENGFDTFAVIYKPGRFQLVNKSRRFDFANIRRDQIEVIGNVHDNPELLGGE